MIKTRIFKFVGHIHNMQLCIEMISFINHENESILRWFSGLCEPRNFYRILCPVAGCIQMGWGSDLCLPAVVLWNSAPHVSTMLGSNLDLSDLVLDILQPDRGRGRGTPPCLTQRSLLRNSEMVMSPQEEHEPSTKASSACWMPRHVRQWSWPSWGARDRPHPETHGW